MSCSPLDYSQVSLLWGMVSPSASSGRLVCQLCDSWKAWALSLAVSGPSSAVMALSPSVSAALRAGVLQAGPRSLVHLCCPRAGAFQRGDGVLLYLFNYSLPLKDLPSPRDPPADS